MSRIMGIAKENVSPEVQGIYEKQEVLYGKALNTLQVYALRPTILQGTTALAVGIEASGLIDNSLKKLVSLKTAIINGCPF